MENIANATLLWLLYVYYEPDELLSFNKRNFQTFLLFLIVTLPYNFTVNNITFSFTFVVLLVFGITLVFNKSWLVQYALIKNSFLLGLFLSSIQLFFLYEHNTSYMFSEYFILFLAFIMFTEFVVQNCSSIYTVLILGWCISECLLYFSYFTLEFDYELGSDTLFVLLFSILIFSLREKIFQYTAKKVIR